MGGLGKIITAILGIIAVLACIATVGIIGYSFVNSDSKADKTASASASNEVQVAVVNEDGNLSPTPTESPVSDATQNQEPQSIASPLHVHDYQQVVIKKANCIEGGEIKYVCSCGDYYVIDTLATGHVPDVDWEIIKEATYETEGQRIKRCIYCDEILARETIPTLEITFSGEGEGVTGRKESTHEHRYIATTEREATCTMAGLRKHECECGDFYTDSIPAIGHVASDWETVEASTATTYGTSQRRCSVCGVVLDIKKLPVTSPSPSASASASASASGSASASASTSASPSPSPHTHSFKTYNVTKSTCTEKGVVSYVCSCGDSYAEVLELDPNNHKFSATTIAATDTQQGYTIYTCERCNYSYMDNYTLPLTRNTSTDASASASPSPSGN